MNNEIGSSKSPLSFSSTVDATLAAIIPDTPIVSIAGSTLSEITTTTTSTTTTPIPTPTLNETNKVDISKSSSSSSSFSSSIVGPSLPSMSGIFPKIAGTASNRANATSSSLLDENATTKATAIQTKSTTTPITKSTLIKSISDSTSTNSSAIADNTTKSSNCDASNNSINANPTVDPQIPTTNIIDTTPTGSGSTSGNVKSTTTTTTTTSSDNNTKAETITTDKKSKDSELWEEEKFTNLDDQNLKLLLEEAYSYRSPTDKENKSELFLSLLEKAENEKEDITLCRMPTSSSRLKRISYSTHNSHNQQNNHHHRHKHGGSLQDLDEAVRNESILDPEYFFGSSCGQRIRRNNHNSRQKKYSTSVSTRQREGGSLPNNVNFTNCARLFGVGGTGTAAGSDVTGLTQLDQQFPFMHEINNVSSATLSSTTVVVASAAASAAGSNCSNSTSINNSTNNSNVGGNNSNKQRRNATRTTSLSAMTSSGSTCKMDTEQLVGQPIGVVIGGQVIPQRSASSTASNGNAASNGNDYSPNSNTLVGTGCRSLKDSICSVNVGDCVIEMGETIVDLQQQQQILQTKSQEAISQGRVFYDRLDNVELMPRSNMLSTVPTRTCFGPTTANAYVDEKVHFTALRGYNPNAASASVGNKPNPVGGVDSKYLPLGDDYKAYKSVLAISDKEDMREVDENGNAVDEAFSVNTTTTHAAATATVYNSINVTSTPVIPSASVNAANTSNSSNQVTTKGKSKKQPKQERNVTTVNVEAVAGYRGFDPVEKLVEYIENTNGGDDNKNKPKKERKKQEKQDKHNNNNNNKITKSNSLEELRSCAKMEVDELNQTAATTESNVMMRNKGKGGKNNSSSAADINKNFETTSSSNNNSGTGAAASAAPAPSAAPAMKEKSTPNASGSGASAAAASAAAGTTNRKAERRSWGNEELQYLGDPNGNKSTNNVSGNGNGAGTNCANNAVSTSSLDEIKVNKDKERKGKNRDNQKDRTEEKDNKNKQIEKGNSSEISNTSANAQANVPAATGNARSNSEKSEKQQNNQQVEKPEKAEKVEKAEKRKKGADAAHQQSTNQNKIGAVTSTEPPITVPDLLPMESVVPETAEFHVVTKKKKTKKQRSSEDSHNNINNTNLNKTHNFISTAANLKAVGGQQQTPRFNTKYNSNNEHSNNTSNGNSHTNNNNNSNSNNHQHHHNNNNHYHNSQQQQQQQQQQMHQQHHQQQQQQQQQNSDKSRRKSTSSVPPSEKSDSSDLDSVHSLPIERAAKLTTATHAVSSNNQNATTKSSKQMRQSNKNTASSATTMPNTSPPKAQQVQQMPTPFSYAEIAKEAKSLNATISSPPPLSNTTNNNNNSTEQTTAVSAPTESTTNNGLSQEQSIKKDEPKSSTHLRGQQQIQTATTTVMPSKAASSSTVPHAATISTTNNTTSSSNSNTNSNPNKTQKTKKTVVKPDFPALGSASDVAVAASAARADIFAKAVLNSSHHQHNHQTIKEAGDNATSVSLSKPNVVAHNDTSPRDAHHNQGAQTNQHHQNQSTHQKQQQQHQQQQQTQHQQLQQQQQQQQHHQTIQKSKSVDHDNSAGSDSSSSTICSNNPKFNSTMDHQQYPALKTVKRHSASNFPTLPQPATTNSTGSLAAAGGNSAQQNVANANGTQFNFAAAARQIPMPLSSSIHSTTAKNSNDVVAPETTTSSIATATATNNAVSHRKSSGAVKERSPTATTSTTTSNTNNPSSEQNSKKNKKEKQQQQQQQQQQQSTTTCDVMSKAMPTPIATTNLSRKSTTATQTSTALLDDQNENNDKSTQNASTVVSPNPSVKETYVNNPSQMLVNNPTQVPSINRPAVIILNDNPANISTDFTFGDFNEDELHFFDDESEEYATVSGGMTAINDELIEEHPVAQITSSSPRSRTISTASLHQLNDSGTLSDLCTTSEMQKVVTSPRSELAMTSSEVIISPNKSTLTAIDNQHSSGIGISASNSNSSRSNVSGSGDSGIYTSTSQNPESSATGAGAVMESSTNVNTFMQRHLSLSNVANETENFNADTTECHIGGGTLQTPRYQQQLETCNEIESAIIAAARRQQQQQSQQQYSQQKPAFSQTSTVNPHYQHSNSNSSSFSSSSSVDGVGVGGGSGGGSGVINKHYRTAHSPTPPSHTAQQPQIQNQQPHYYRHVPYTAVHHPQQPQQQQHLQQYYHQNYNMMQQPIMVVNTPNASNVYSRSNSECDEDYVSPPPMPGTFVVQIQNKEYDLHYMPPNNNTPSTTYVGGMGGASQNDFIVEYVSSVWDEVVNSTYTRFYDGQ